jgi:hypothetical protein
MEESKITHLCGLDKSSKNNSPVEFHLMYGQIESVVNFVFRSVWRKSSSSDCLESANQAS